MEKWMELILQAVQEREMLDKNATPKPKKTAIAKPSKNEVAVPCPEEIVATADNLSRQQKAEILLAMVVMRLNGQKFKVVPLE